MHTHLPPFIGCGKKTSLTRRRRRRRTTTGNRSKRKQRRVTTARKSKLPQMIYVKTAEDFYPSRSRKLPKTVYVKAPPVPSTPSQPHFHQPTPMPEPPPPILDRQSVWRGVQMPQIPIPYPYYQPIQVPIQQLFQPSSTTVLPQQISVTTPTRPMRSEEDWYDAPQWPENRRPADGEADSDTGTIPKMKLDDILDFLTSLPGRLRKVILTGLFGTAVGMAIDLMLGSPLGLTSRVIRTILRMLPGGWIILAGFDGLGYILGQGKAVLSLPHDPSFTSLAQKVQTQIPPGTAERLAHLADQQVGGDTFASGLAALLHAVYLRISMQED